jgi:hypothetical protein
MPFLKLGEKLKSGNLQKLGAKLTSSSHHSFGKKLQSLNDIKFESDYQNSYTPVKGDESFIQHGKYSEFEKPKRRKHYA